MLLCLYFGFFFSVRIFYSWSLVYTHTRTPTHKWICCCINFLSKREKRKRDRKLFSYNSCIVDLWSTISLNTHIMALTYLTHGGGILENKHINHVYALIHSFTHLLTRSLCIHCGEEPAVRERESESYILQTYLCKTLFFFCTSHRPYECKCYCLTKSMTIVV